MDELRDAAPFREFGGPAGAPSLRDYISDTSQPDEDKIIAYLDNGIGLAGRGGYVSDVLDPSIKGLSAHTLTDGVYVWTSDLGYYVEKYHLRLPNAFIAHMKSKNWEPPDEDRVNSGD